MDITKHKETEPHQDFWVRWGWIWSLIYLVALLTGWLVAVFSNGLRGTPLLAATALVLGLAIWHGWWAFVFIRRLTAGIFRERPLRTSLHLLMLVLGWYLLIQINSAFFFVLFGMFGLFYYFLPLAWAMAGSAFLTLLIIFSEAMMAGRFNAPFAIGLLISLVLGSLFAFWLHGIIVQSSSRRELVEQLQQTRAELAASERLAGQLAERQRLAQDIHDTLAQGFISIVMHLEAAEQSMGADPTITQHHLDQARQTARDSLGQARRVVDDLRPELLESAPFHQAMARTAQRWSRQSGVDMQFSTTGEIYSLHPAVEVTLLRGVQEALANIRKHARATAVSVTLSYLADQVILDVQDNGVGFGEAKRGEAVDLIRGGYGLTAMRQRVADLGGEVTIESDEKEGTTLALSIPIGRKDE